MTANRAYNARHDAARRKSGICLSKHDLWPIRPHTCALCGKPLAWVDASVDHIISLDNDGDETLDNLQLAHRTCNARKGYEERKRKAA